MQYFFPFCNPKEPFQQGPRGDAKKRRSLRGVPFWRDEVPARGSACLRAAAPREAGAGLTAQVCTRDNLKGLFCFATCPAKRGIVEESAPSVEFFKRSYTHGDNRRPLLVGSKNFLDKTYFCVFNGRQHYSFLTLKKSKID